MPDVPTFLWSDAGDFAAPVTYVVPGAGEVQPYTSTATFVNNSGQSILPALRLKSASGNLLALVFPQGQTIVSGDTSEVTWAPFRLVTETGEQFPRTVGELGFTGSGTQSDTYTHTITFEDVLASDGILVSAQAPSVPAALTLPRRPTDCEDSQGNVYGFVGTHFWEANPPNVNEGATQQFFFAQPPVVPLTAGVDTITVTWGGAVYDRSIYAWLIRNANGAPYPYEIAANADNDAAVFADTKVTLHSPGWTPTLNNSMALATLMAIKAGGVGAFGGVAGFDGYFQAQFRRFFGSKQQYLFNVNTYGDNVYLIVGAAQPQYELDLGILPAGVAVPAFNGAAQNYSAGANAWKGITIWAVS